MVSPQLVPDLIVVMWSVCPVLGELRIEMWPLVDIRAPSDLEWCDLTLLDNEIWWTDKAHCHISGHVNYRSVASHDNTRSHCHPSETMDIRYRQFYSEFELLRRHNYWHQLYWHHPLRYTFKDPTHFVNLYRGVVPPIDTKSLLTSSETIDIIFIAWL